MPRTNIIIQAGSTLSMLESFNRYFSNTLIENVNKASINLTEYTKRRYLSGRPGLISRSGEMRESTVPVLNTSRSRRHISAGMAIGTSSKARRYVNTHVSDTPRSMTIQPTRSKFLTLPLGKARSARDRGVEFRASDVPRPTRVYRPKSGVYAGKLIMAHRKGSVSIPYFELRRFVTVYTRVHTEEILDNYSPYIMRTLVRGNRWLQ